MLASTKAAPSYDRESLIELGSLIRKHAVPDFLSRRLRWQRWRSRLSRSPFAHTRSPARDLPELA